MPGTDDGIVDEQLAQARAKRPHMLRLHAAEQRDAKHEHQADIAADREAQPRTDRETSGTSSHPADEWRRTLLAEHAALELDRESLLTDRYIADDIDRDL